jgi:hypothetical protein
LNRIEAEKQAELTILSRPVQSAEPIDSFSLTLACACDETLTLVRTSRKPIERAQLARALRDLRETWHMATGKPKPGMLKPDSMQTRRREMPRNVYPDAYGQKTSEPDPGTPKT